MSVVSSAAYAGGDLAVFEKARNWKNYWRRHVAPFIRGDVLGVGAGTGSNTRLLSDLSFDSWTAVEPDARLAERIAMVYGRHRKVVGTIADIEGRFDTVLYIDVLEHIEDDRGELECAAQRLRAG